MTHEETRLHEQEPSSIHTERTTLLVYTQTLLFMELPML